MGHGLWAARGTITVNGLISVGLGFTAQVVAQCHMHAADAAIILSSETVFASLCGALLMGDRINAAGWLGCALMLASIVIVQCLPAAPRTERAAAPPVARSSQGGPGTGKRSGPPEPSPQNE